jgi:hypothetical protein
MSKRACPAAAGATAVTKRTKGPPHLWELSGFLQYDQVDPLSGEVFASLDEYLEADPPGSNGLCGKSLLWWCWLRHDGTATEEASNGCQNAELHEAEECPDHNRLHLLWLDWGKYPIRHVVTVKDADEGDVRDFIREHGTHTLMNV